MITADEFDQLVEDGFDYEFTDWKGNKSTEHVEGNEFWCEGYDVIESVDLPGVGTLTYVAGETGGEGSAEHIWQVWKIGDQYFRKTGYYASYDGSNWDGGLHEVEPFEKTVIDWKTK